MNASRLSDLDRNKQLVRSFLEAVDRHDEEAFMRLVAPDHQLNFTGNAKPLDRAAHWRLASSYGACFSEMRHTPLEMIAEGDRVVTRGEITGVHTGPFNGIGATGRRIHTMFINILRIVDGRICGAWALVDSNTVRDQLGVAVDYREGQSAS